MKDDNFELKDSGKRREFVTGAVRDRGELKPRPDLVSPHAQIREGMVFARGAEKYDIRNWEKGMPISECLASAQRHIEQYKRGDTDEDHIAQARWNLGAIIHYEEEIKAGRMDLSIDDMPKYVQRPDWETDDGRGVVIPSDTDDKTDLQVFCPLVSAAIENMPSSVPPGDITFQNMPIVYDRTLDPLICNCCGARMDCPTERCAACGWCVYDCVDPREGNLAMMTGVPSSRPTATEIVIKGRNQTVTEVEEKAWADPHKEIKRGLGRTPDPIHGLVGPCLTEPPTFYIAGPMRGYENLNFPAFDEATERGRALGYNIISPTDLDREHGIDPMKDATVVEHENTLSAADLNVIVRRDTEVIMALQPAREDGIAVLPGWENSTGATAEVALARWLGLRVVYATDFCTEVN